MEAVERIIVAGVVATAALLAGCTTAAARPAAKIRVLASGTHSGVRHQEYYALHDVTDFRNWWQRAYSSRATAPALPQVDFSKDMVVVVFMGEKSHGGYSLHVDKVTDTADSYDVEITVNIPGSGCRTTQALIQPFEFVAVPDSGNKFVNWKVQQHYQTCES
ncbi:MAG TPA: protease complex subunit PrcB family protein [Gammaproteobacteria bacterium]|nr:protease complex subunit PrcB family protein [Gammaproteobacteria bacterium]